MRHIALPALAIATALAIASCGKHTITPAPQPVAPVTNGVYVLLQGGRKVGNVNYQDDTNFKSTLAFYDPATKTLTPDRFSLVNGSPLGFKAFDMAVYGSKLYIALAGSGNVTVVDAATTRLLGRTTPERPNSIRYYTTYSPVPVHFCFFEGYAYVGLENSTIAVMDTATLKIIRYINAAPNEITSPTGPVVANGKLYVGGFDGFGSGNLQIFDPHSGAFLRGLDIYIGPLSLSTDAAGNVYVETSYDTASLDALNNSNFKGFSPGITVISSATDRVIYQAASGATGAAPILVSGNAGYYITGNYNSSTIQQLHVNGGNFSFNLSPYMTGSTLGEVTALALDQGGQLYVGDSKEYNSTDGTVDVFLNQQLEYSFPAGTNIVKIIPVP
jgi:hypothetical protein